MFISRWRTFEPLTPTNEAARKLAPIKASSAMINASNELRDGCISGIRPRHSSDTLNRHKSIDSGAKAKQNDQSVLIDCGGLRHASLEIQVSSLEGALMHRRQLIWQTVIRLNLRPNMLMHTILVCKSMASYCNQPQVQSSESGKRRVSSARPVVASTAALAQRINKCLTFRRRH